MFINNLQFRYRSLALFPGGSLQPEHICRRLVEVSRDGEEGFELKAVKMGEDESTDICDVGWRRREWAGC